MSIYGGPGTGKSTVIACVKKLLGDRCIVGAYIGSCAHNVCGETLHTLLNIPVGRNGVLSEKKNANYYKQLKDVDYLIIDEISMVGQRMLSTVDRHLRCFKVHLQSF